MFRLASLMLFVSTFAYAQKATNEVKVTVTGIQQIQGTIRACLVTSKGEYLGKCTNGNNVKVTNQTALLVFENIPQGSYCIMLYHDIDNNGRLNTDGMFGMPSEPYGFSNNPRSWFGPPAYEKCLFTLRDSMNITIEL